MSRAPVAIIGRGCVLPGALTPSELWALSRAGRSALSPAPAGLWGVAPGVDRQALAREAVSELGGHVTGFERVFSPNGFQLDVDASLDPVFLWPLHAAREALRESGRDVTRHTVRGAVVLGNLSYPTPGLARFATEVWGGHRPTRPHDRFMSGLPAELVARALGFVGPAFALDAACASSLYAIKLACDRLQEGSVDLAIAGGVNHADSFFLHLGFTSLGALSPTGQSRPFHRAADGLVPAQGAAVVLLKRLSDALHDGDRVLGVIRGVGLSNDGRSRGLLVPSLDGQVRAMRSAWDLAQLSPREVSFVECHATGTLVGDAVEARSLRQVFEGCSDVPLASLKSNVGHLITASGSAGLINVLSAMEAEVRPPSNHADAPIAELAGPLRLVQSAEPWPADRRRIAGISNFGFGGNNAHLVVEEGRAITGARVSVSQPRAREPIAVVGLEVRAGAAAHRARFEQALREGESLVRGGAARAEPFELELTGLRFPPADLRDALPQQTWLVDAVMSLVNQQGPTGELMRALPRATTGLLVGMQCDAEAARCGLEWRLPGSAPGRLAERPLRPAVTVGCMANILANRLNQQLGFEAPSFSISSEETSGTTALELGLHALRSRELDAAIVAAVDLSCEPVQRAAAELLGKCSTPGDAVVVLVLERLDDARRAGHPILAELHDEALGEELADLSWFWGHPHAAVGLLHVAAAILSCRSGFRPPAPGTRAEPWNAGPASRRLMVKGLSVRGSAYATRESDVPKSAGLRLPIDSHLGPVKLAVAPHPAQALVDRHRELTEGHLSFMRELMNAHLRFLGSAPALSKEPVREAPLTRGSAHATIAPAQPLPADTSPPRILSRKQLEALASEPISAVLGPAFRGQDQFKRVVRLPQPPLLLADRVTGIEGEPNSMGKGTIWTETDVAPEAWYLHDGRMPAGVLIESGQADLLLISWLGVDQYNRGERVYRLLGCDLTCHGPLPKPGDTLSYEIHVDGHATQGDVRLFFFHYDCHVNGKLLVRVRNGQAGFFTERELAESAGVLFRPEAAKPTQGASVSAGLTVSKKRAFSSREVQAFIDGRLTECFGDGFERASTHARTPTIQGGTMRLVEEVTHFDPEGGPWKRGYLRARLPLSPEQWFFHGHFKDDPCMPGTLMFEGGLQAMALYLAAMGFTLERDGFRFEPVPDHEYRLRCRGQATPASKELIYEVFVDELLGGPQPTLYVDLLGSVDGLRAFHCRRMGVRLVPGEAIAVTAAADSRAARLFPVFAKTPEALQRAVVELQRSTSPFPQLSAELCASKERGLAYVVVARDGEELRAELGRATQGLSRALTSGETWKTPSGSVFAPRPLGREGKVTFVYPGMGSAALGAGRGLFRRFPQLLDELVGMKGLAIGHELASAMTASPSASAAEAFSRDAVRVSSTSMAFSYALTRLLRAQLGVEPQAALGFSVGEGSMFPALGLWADPSELERRLSRSLLFRERLAGPMSAVREDFGLSEREPFSWTALIIQAPRERVREALLEHPRVRLLTIHTANEVMVGGTREACERLIDRLGAPSTFVPLELAMHCGGAMREHAALRELHLLPVAPDPRITLHSAARALPLEQNSGAIADALADSFAQTVDFPALIERAWADGSRVFVEVGGRANCSSWISRVLQGRPHACAPLMARLEDEDTSLVRGLATLVTHGVPLELTRLSAAAPAAQLSTAGRAAAAAEGPWVEILKAHAAALLDWSDASHVPLDEPLPIDSLAVMDLRVRLQRQLGKAVPVELFFAHRTVRSLAAALTALGLPLEQPAPATAPSRPGARYPGAWSQHEMWQMARQVPSSLTPAELHRKVPVLWMRSRLGLRGPLDVPALASAVRTVFDRHDILCSRVDDRGQQPPDVERLEGWTPELELIETTPEHEADRIEAFLARGLDPEQGPPARIALVKTGPEQHSLCLLQHHLFTDGLSLMRFWREVFELLLDPSAEPLVSSSFAQFAQAQREWLASPASAASRRYWTETLRGARPLVIPSDEPRRVAHDFAGEREAVRCSAETLQRLEALKETEGVGFFAVLLTALANTFHRETGQDDLLFTTFHANRALPNFPDAFDVVGPLVQELPLRVQLKAEHTARERLRDVHRRVIEALEHGSVPVGYLQQVEGVAVPTPQVSLMYQSFAPPPSFEVGPLTVMASEPLGFGEGMANFELELVLWPEGDALRGVASWARQIFRSSTGQRLVHRFHEELLLLSRS